MGDAFDTKLREEPLPYRAPCAGCAHLQDDGDKHYVACAVSLPPLPIWVIPGQVGGLVQSFRRMTRKYVFGPHVPDAPIHRECPLRAGGARG